MGLYERAALVPNVAGPEGVQSGALPEGSPTMMSRHRLRITYVVDRFAGVDFLEFLSEAARDHEISLWVLSEIVEGYAQTLEDNGVDVVHVGEVGRRSYPALVRRMSAWLRTHKVDVVHADASALGLVAGLLARTPVRVITRRPGDRHHQLRNPVDIGIDCLSNHLADGVVAIGAPGVDADCRHAEQQGAAKAQRFTTSAAIASTLAAYDEARSCGGRRVRASHLLDIVHWLARSGVVGGRIYSVLAFKAMGLVQGEVVRLPTGGAVVLDQNDWISRNVVLGFYERAELAMFSHLVNPGDTVVDVGANIGFWTTHLAHWVSPHGRVLAVEPSPRCLGALRRAVDSNPGWNVEISPAGAGPRDMRGVLVGHANAAHSGLGSVVAEDSASGGMAVAVRSMASLMDEHRIGQCEMLKIDVEGLEAEVLEGLGDRLRNGSIRSLVLEVSPEFGNSAQVATLLSSLGSSYNFFRVGERGRFIRRPTLQEMTPEKVHTSVRQFNLLAVDDSRLAQLERFVIE